MAQRRCYGCMGMTGQPVCQRCGTREEERNLPHQLPRGTVLAGRFLVGKALQTLPGAIAYLALDQSLGEPVRLLEFYPGDAARREGAEVKPAGPAFAKGAARFRRVSEALGRDSRLTEVSGTQMTFEENGTCYRVCELLRGGTLKKYVEMRGGFLLPEEALGILDGLMEALDVFHREGFSHGGLDWEAIVLDSRGGPRLPRIGDNPGRNPGEDTASLCRVFLDCLGREPDERLREIPGLTGPLAEALEKGLSPGGGFATAGQLRGAMLGGAPAVPPESPPPPAQREEPAQARRPEAVSPPKKSPPPKRPGPAKSSGGGNRRRKGSGNGGKKTGVLVLAAVVLLILGALSLIAVRNIHVWKEADCLHPYTCVICGETYGAPLGHDWMEATCTAPRTCARCAEQEGPIPGHDWQEATCTEPETCARCGQTRGEPLGHDWQEATCTEPETCARCGQTQGEPLGHAWQEGGGQPRTCARCGEEDLGYIKTLAGDWERFRWGSARTWCFRADCPVSGVWSLTLCFKPEIHMGIPITRWKFLYQEPGGDWVEYGAFRLDGESAEETIRFSHGVDISAVAVIPVSGGFTYDFSLSVTDIRFEGQPAAEG